MQTLFIQADNLGAISNVRISALEGQTPPFLEYNNCPDDVLSFPSNYVVKWVTPQVSGSLVSLVSSNYPYPERPYRVEISYEDMADLAASPNYNYLITAANKEYAVKDTGKYIVWFNNLSITFPDGTTQSTESTISILANVAPNIKITKNPLLA